LAAVAQSNVTGLIVPQGQPSLMVVCVVSKKKKEGREVLKNQSISPLCLSAIPLPGRLFLLKEEVVILASTKSL
jgi:hypothetical protein